MDEIDSNYYVEKGYEVNSKKKGDVFAWLSGARWRLGGGQRRIDMDPLK